MSRVRPPAVAGTFYPAHPGRLRQAVAEYLSAPAAGPGPPPGRIVALIAPHAGYIYSGPIAGAAYGCLQAAARPVTRVVLLGPAHTMPVPGLAASSAAAFASPLGEAPLDQEAVADLAMLPQVQLLDAAHAREHGLEVHLPFLQTVLPAGFRLVPLVVGEATPAQVTAVLARLLAADAAAETLIVISSDLSHYHDYDTARRLDAATARAIETMEPEAIGRDQACGRVPIQGLLRLGREAGWRNRTLDLRNSGDTAGPRDRVVGYGAWAFWTAPK